MSRWIILIGLLAAPLAAQTPEPVEIKIGSPAPVLMLPDLEAKPVRVGHVAGKKAAVIEFWATWCPLCEELLPRMVAAKSRFGASVDFYGINVTVNDPKARVKRYVSDHKPPYITLYDDKGVGARTFQAFATSHVVIIDKNGIVRYIGDGGKQDIAGELEKMLKP